MADTDTPWDDLMKILASASPQDLVSFLSPNAKFKHTLDKELKARTVKADFLGVVEWNGEEIVLHIEYQRYRDGIMDRRLWEYNVLTDCLTNKKVRSFVIYLRPDGNMIESPYVQRFSDGEVNHVFYFRNIKLWEFPMEAFLQDGMEGLLPLLPLASGNRNEKVNAMITGLQAANKNDLLILGYAFAVAVYNSKEDTEWLKRRFAMLESALEGSWVYKEIIEKGLVQGRKEGLDQGKLQNQRQDLVAYVDVQFPELTALAKERVEQIEDWNKLHTMLLALYRTRVVEKAKLILLEEQS